MLFFGTFSLSQTQSDTFSAVKWKDNYYLEKFIGKNPENQKLFWEDID